MHDPELEPVACGLCGQDDAVTVYAGCEDVIYRVPGPAFDDVRCRGCGLVRTSPRPGPDAMSRWYEGGYASWEAQAAPRSRGGGARAAFALPHRLRFGAAQDPAGPPRPGACALEVGAGAGGALRELAGRGWEAWGVEAHPRGDGAAEGVRIVAARAEDAELPKGHFDRIGFTHSLEHLHDPLGVMRRARGWLRTGGEIRIAVPNFDSRERKVFGRYWNGLDVPRHLWHFTPRTLGLLLEEAGLRLDSVAPQFQGSSTGGSLQHAASHLGRKRPYRPSGPVYWAGLPVGWLASGLRNGAFIEAVARPAA